MLALMCRPGTRRECPSSFLVTQCGYSAGNQGSFRCLLGSLIQVSETEVDTQEGKRDEASDYLSTHYYSLRKLQFTKINSIYLINALR